MTVPEKKTSVPMNNNDRVSLMRLMPSTLETNPFVVTCCALLEWCQLPKPPSTWWHEHPSWFWQTSKLDPQHSACRGHFKNNTFPIPPIIRFIWWNSTPTIVRDISERTKSFVPYRNQTNDLHTNIVANLDQNFLLTSSLANVIHWLSGASFDDDKWKQIQMIVMRKMCLESKR